MANVNYYQVKKKIDGVEYTAQFNGMRASMKAMDNSRLDGGGLSTEKWNQTILETAIVEPAGLDLDDFEDMETLNEVVAFAREVMQGKFRQSTDKITVKQAGK